MAHASGDESPVGFTERFQELHTTVYPRSQKRPYTAGQISRGITKLGGKVSTNYLQLLLTGERQNPSAEVVMWICLFYDQPSSYFIDEDITDQLKKLKLLAAFRDAGVENIARLATGLTPENLDLLEDLARSLRRRQGLGDDDVAASPPAIEE